MVLLASASAACAQSYCWTELAGAGQGLASVYGVTYDSGSGLTWTVDLSSGAIKSITSGGTVTTPGATFGQPLGVAVNSTTHDLYVADNGAAAVYRIVSPYGNANKTIIDSGYGCIGIGVDQA